MQISTKEVRKGLDQLVKISFLHKGDEGYKHHPKYKETLLKCKGKTKEEILVEALWMAGYFEGSKTEREIEVVCSLLLLEK